MGDAKSLKMTGVLNKWPQEHPRLGGRSTSHRLLIPVFGLLLLGFPPGLGALSFMADTGEVVVASEESLKFFRTPDMNGVARIIPVTRGWRNYYRYATNACEVFNTLDSWVWWRVTRWLGKKHRKVAKHKVRPQYARKLRHTRWAWGEGETLLLPMVDGGTSRFLFRGTKISNGWNDQEDRFSSEEAAGHSETLNTLGQRL